MSDVVLADTSFIVALFNIRDVHHERAIKIHQYLRRSHKKLVITDVVVNETLGALKRRFKEKKEGNFRKVAEKNRCYMGKRKGLFLSLCIFGLERNNRTSSF